jgi:hypothetical protein
MAPIRTRAPRQATNKAGGPGSSRPFCHSAADGHRAPATDTSSPVPGHRGMGSFVPPAAPRASAALTHTIATVSTVRAPTFTGGPRKSSTPASRFTASGAAAVWRDPSCDLRRLDLGRCGGVRSVRRARGSGRTRCLSLCRWGSRGIGSRWWLRPARPDATRQLIRCSCRWSGDA